MVASNEVIVTQETRQRLNNEALSPKKKRELREQMIIECIRSAVGGTRTKQELVAAAGFNPHGKHPEYATGLSLIKTMIRQGKITHNNTGSFKKNWTILADVKVKPSPKAIAESVVEEKESQTELVVELRDKVQVNKGTLVNLAKEFAWKHNSDSLREFITYAETRLK